MRRIVVRVAIVGLLLACLAAAVVRTFGAPALEDAAAMHRVGKVWLLLALGANPNGAWSPANRHAFSPLNRATGRESPRELATVELLLARGADPNSALASAVFFGSVETARLLLEHGANPNAADVGDPLLSQAVRNIGDARPGDGGYVVLNEELARLLLEHGAKADAANRWGITPLHVVAEHWRRGDPRLLAAAGLLLAHGANVNAQDSLGRTPLDCAKGWGAAGPMAKLLVGHGGRPGRRPAGLPVPRISAPPGAAHAGRHR